jgi:hypothetical protein
MPDTNIETGLTSQQSCGLSEFPLIDSAAWRKQLQRTSKLNFSWPPTFLHLLREILSVGILDIAESLSA